MESASTRSQRFWPADNEFISDGAKIRYLDTAEGSNTVLLIHGWSTSTLMWSNRKPFSTNIIDPLVSAGFRVVAMDCRGHGLSEKFYDDEDYGIKMVQDHLNLLDHLEVEAAHVVGASMGAEIAIKLAVTHPNRVKSLCPAGSGWSQGTSYYQVRRSIRIRSLEKFISATTIRASTLRTATRRSPTLARCMASSLGACALAGTRVAAHAGFATYWVRFPIAGHF